MLVTAWQSAGAAVEVGGLFTLHEKVAILWLVIGIMRGCGYAETKADNSTGDSNADRERHCPGYCRKSNLIRCAFGN